MMSASTNIRDDQQFVTKSPITNEDDEVETQNVNMNLGFTITTTNFNKLIKESKFNAHKVSNVSYDAIPEHVDQYFTAEGTTIAENITPVGKVKTTGNFLFYFIFNYFILLYLQLFYENLCILFSLPSYQSWRS